MRNSLKIFGIALLGLAVLQGCNSPQGQENGDMSNEKDTSMNNMNQQEGGQMNNMGEHSMKKNGLTLRPADDSKKFPNASLKVSEPKVGANIKNGEVNFKFNVKNYALKKKTTDQDAHNLAFSGKGQHIHLILNNGPYSAIYKNQTMKNLEDGPYVGIAFLARSYHESVKNPEAAFPFAFSVGKETNADKMLSQPLLFYSRPKGTYAADKSDPLLFDFYMVNADLGSKYKARLTIDGKSKFMIDKWQAYYVEGLKAGDHDFKLELLDQDGNPVHPDFNTTTRHITIK